MLNRNRVTSIWLSCVLTAVALPAKAAPEFAWAESKPLSETWVNPGMITYHYQRDVDLNDFNPGLGFEYRYSTTSSLTAGVYYNSDREYSRYAGIYWQPITFDKVRIGAVVGVFDGYPNMKDGGWFLAAIPVLSYESGNLGLNFGIVPNYKDRLYGALSFQFKYRISGD